MAITITDYLKIDKNKFDELGAFDSFLDINSKLFVSPMLLKRTNNPFFKDSYNDISKKFNLILKLLRVSTIKGDRSVGEILNRKIDEKEATFLELLD